MTCLDDYALERALLSTPPAHVETCGLCAARLARMREENERFRRFVFPATVDAVAASVAPPRWKWPLVVSVPLALAAAAVLVLQATPPRDYEGLKGAAPSLALDVFTQDSSGTARRVTEPAAISSRASLRFQIRAPAPCYLWLVSIDGAGQVSRLFPTSGPAVLVSQTTTLPGGASLDGQAGPERLIAVCTAQPLSFEAVERAVRVTSPDGVRQLRSLEGVADHTSLLLEKQNEGIR